MYSVKYLPSFKPSVLQADSDLYALSHMKDHVHILFQAHPNSEISKFINAYKSASSRLLKKEFPTIRTRLWKEYFWSRSFCLLTAGGAPLDVIKQYIESQGTENEQSV